MQQTARVPMLPEAGLDVLTPHLRVDCVDITHRCHERQYLFRFAKYRDMYRKYLLEASRRFNVSVLSYVVTYHVHVLLATGERGRPQVSEAMQYLHGEVAQHYNLAKRREGSFWANRFRATWVQSGTHLRRCLFYIDMNIVRVGVVAGPAEWRHGSAHELAGDRRRYRIVDRDRLLERLELPDWGVYTDWYARPAAPLHPTRSTQPPQRSNPWRSVACSHP